MRTDISPTNSNNDPTETAEQIGFMIGTVLLRILFCILLLVGGLAFHAMSIIPAIQASRAGHWTATPCVIVVSRVVEHKNEGKDTTYSMELRYQYTVNDVQHESGQYDFVGSFSGGYKENAQIVNRYAKGATAVCYVNPAKPAQAVLDRGYSNEMVAGLIPLFLFYIGVVGLTWNLTLGRPARLISAPTNQPWLRRPDWAARRIIYSPKTRALFLWWTAGICNLVGIPVLILLTPGMIEPGHHLLAILLIAPAIGLILLILAIRATWLERFFGNSSLELRTLPGQIGGALECILHLSRPMEADGGFNFRLRSVAHDKGMDSGKRRNHILEEMKHTVNSRLASAIAVAFTIPSDCITTCLESNDSVVNWTLHVTATVDGHHYAANFEVPIYEVDLTLAQKAEAARVEAGEGNEMVASHRTGDSKIQVQATTRGGMEFYFPRGRNPGVVAILALFLAAWSATIVFFITAQDVLLIFAIAFGALEPLFIWFLLYVLLVRKRVVIEQGMITITSSLLGPGRTRRIPAGDIEEIFARQIIENDASKYRDIAIVLKNHRQITAGSAIKSVAEAEWIAAEMEKAAGLRN